MLIAGDIGGTKTDLAIFSVETGPHTPLAQEPCIAPNTRASKSWSRSSWPK